MAKNPAFPFYANDYLVDTLRWSRGMKSLHVDLMAESWANGRLLDDGGCPEGLSGDDRKLWTKIAHKWKLVDGCWINEKLEKCRIERENFLKRQSEKGKKSAEARKEPQPDTQPKTNHGSTTVQPLEGEEEKVFIKIIKEQEKKVERLEVEIDDPLIIACKDGEIRESDFKYMFSETMLEDRKRIYKDVDVEDQLVKFKIKVRDAPRHYQSHTGDGLKLAFDRHLQSAPKKKTGDGKSFSKNDRSEFNQNELAIIQQHAAGSK